MRNRFDDFDQEFAATKKTIKRWQWAGMIFTILINLALLALLILAIYAVGRFVGVW